MGIRKLTQLFIQVLCHYKSLTTYQMTYITSRPPFLVICWSVCWNVECFELIPTLRSCPNGIMVSYKKTFLLCFVCSKQSLHNYVFLCKILQLMSEFTTQGKGKTKVRKKCYIFLFGNFDVCTKRSILCVCLGISNKRHWMIHKMYMQPATCYLLAHWIDSYVPAGITIFFVAGTYSFTCI